MTNEYHLQDLFLCGLCIEDIRVVGNSLSLVTGWNGRIEVTSSIAFHLGGDSELRPKINGEVIRPFRYVLLAGEVVGQISQISVFCFLSQLSRKNEKRNFPPQARVGTMGKDFERSNCESAKCHPTGYQFNIIISFLAGRFNHLRNARPVHLALGNSKGTRQKELVDDQRKNNQSFRRKSW